MKIEFKITGQPVEGTNKETYGQRFIADTNDIKTMERLCEAACESIILRCEESSK